jgi:8-oxo-dGTP diphosphatase/2-hydroxy-dATP diphosphatase
LGQEEWIIQFQPYHFFLPEMQPQWFPEDGIPYDQMWPDDILWYPLYLKGIKFKGYFLYQGHDTILEYTLTEVDHLS